MYAWITAVAGLVTINTLAAISVDRYWAVVRRATPEQRLSKRVTSMVVIAVWAYSISWAICPILGWGDYILDGIGTTCTFDYLTRTWWNRSFVIAMATGNFLLPFSLMVFCYMRIWAAVREVKRGLETDFPQATQGGGGNSVKDTRPSFFSTWIGGTANKDAGLPVFTGGNSNSSSKTSRSSVVSSGSSNCDGKDVKVFYSCNRPACPHRIDNQTRLNSSILSGQTELSLSCDDSNLTKYDENRNKSPSNPSGPSFPKGPSLRSGPVFSVHFRRRPEIVVALGGRRHVSRRYTNCGSVCESDRASTRCRNTCICERVSRGQSTIGYTSRGCEQAPHSGGCRFAFKSSRAMTDNGMAREMMETDTSRGCGCQRGSSRHRRESDNNSYKLLPRRALRSFHNCCSSCCHRQSGGGSPRCGHHPDNEETLISTSRGSADLSCSGEHRCRESSASSTERSRAKIKQRHHRLNCEHKTLRIILFLLLAFTIAWCPYLAVSLVGLFGDQSKISFLTSVLPSLFAKTSIVTNPILYSISHPKVRKRILTSILCPSHLSKPTYHVRMRTNQSSFGVSNSQ